MQSKQTDHFQFCTKERLFPSQQRNTRVLISFAWGFFLSQCLLPRSRVQPWENSVTVSHLTHGRNMVAVQKMCIQATQPIEAILLQMVDTLLLRAFNSICADPNPWWVDAWSPKNSYAMQRMLLNSLRTLNVSFRDEQVPSDGMRWAWPTTPLTFQWNCLPDHSRYDGLNSFVVSTGIKCHSDKVAT